MRPRRLAAALLLLAPTALAACGLVWTYDDYVDQPGAGAGGAATTGGDAGTDAAGGQDAGRDAGPLRDAGGHDAAKDAAHDAAADAEADAEADAAVDGAASKPDPAEDGPYAYVELDGEYVAETGDTVGVHAVVPTSGPAAGPYPVVLFAHAFNIPWSQYAGYLKRLASFGYVAVAPAYPSGFGLLSTPDPKRSTRDFLDALGWVAQAPELAGVADLERVGASGHSYGGKIAFHAATLDARVKAAITLDPVDSSSSCDPSKCVDVSDLLPTLGIPVGVVGETRDETTPPLALTGACAPASANFETFYASAKGPALSVEVLAARHWSFLDDVATCGIWCGACTSHPAEIPDEIVRGLSRSFLAAFFERWIRGDARYDDNLTGVEATQRYVVSGLAVIQSK